MASIPHQSMFEELLHEYDTLQFVKPNGTLDLTTNVVRITEACTKYSFIPNNKRQTVNGSRYFLKIIYVQSL